MTTLSLLTLLAAPAVASDPAEAPPAEEAAPVEHVMRWPGQAAADYRHLDLERMYVDGRYDEILKIAKQRVAADPSDPDPYWHIARALFEIGEAFERDAPGVDKVAHYTEMVRWAEKGLAVDPGNTHLVFARGIANGRLGTTKGVLSSLFLAKHVEADWLHTANSGLTYSSLDGSERLPCDAWVALGIFYRLVPDLWVVQVLAGTRGSLDKSLEYLTKADTCAPNRIGPMKELGVTRLCIGTKRGDDAMLAAGKAAIQAYMKLPPANRTDEIDLKHGPLLLADPSIACGYSRDGQQDLDREQLERGAR